MSTKERRRLAVLEQVKSGRLSLVAASARLGLSYRQTRRVFQRFKSEGDAGLVHRLRGQAGNRRVDPAVRERAVSLYGEHYGDFGCTLACEYLAERHDLVVDDQTLRRWLASAGLWRRRRKSPVKRRRRERRASFGELVQIDGSHHDWFEGRASASASSDGSDEAGEPVGRCVLMVMIDDATGFTLARFFDAETTAAAMTMFRLWSLEHGLPLELYPDRDSIYRVNTKAADEEEARTGRRPPTQFGRAMTELDVKVTCAKSPQAKGRVERMNGTLQDRLIKALRVAGISDMDSANAFLEQTFLPQLNARFTVPPANEVDAHRPVSEAELDAALCVREQRKVSKDHCVSWEGRVMQLKVGLGLPSLAGKQVTVRRSLDGTVTVHWRDRVVEWEALKPRPVRAAPVLPLVERVASHTGPQKPSADHPWRHDGPATRRPPTGPGSAPASAAPRPALRQAQPAG